MSIGRLSKEHKASISDTVSNLWKNDKYKRHIFFSRNMRPNKPEKFLIQLFAKCDIQLQYVGNGKVWFTDKDNNRYNPDFINKEKKKILEFFGSYWHVNQRKRDKQRVKTFLNSGYETLVIWDYDLEDLSKVVSRIHQFIK